MSELQSPPLLPGRAQHTGHPLFRFRPLTLAPHWVALILAIWCTLALNQAWWNKLTELSHEQALTWLQTLTTAAVLTAANYLWLMTLSWPKIRRIGWSLTLIVGAAVQYFMLHYGIVMDSSMMRNTLQTNTSESLALMTSGLLGHIALYAGLPIAALYGCVLLKTTYLRRSALLVFIAIGVLVGGGLWLYKPMAPLIRNHTEIRYLVNPLASIVSFTNVTIKPLFKRKLEFRRISQDATLGKSYQEALTPGIAGSTPRKPPLLVLIVGETARADHFGLNGYPRNTTPAMEARHVISWRNVRSCGTNTQASVPCMFSHLGKSGFESRSFEYENLLDVVHAAGLNVDWLDNQSGCKGVCNRISNAQADKVAKPETVKSWCKSDECLDQMMVGLLDERLQLITQHDGNDKGSVLVLHQMGSHGPAYYRRSTPQNKHFQPECTTHVTSDCSRAELVNVYDNSIVETDLFIARTIDWLKSQQDRYDVGLIYLSDHGESLGENGLYLHGLPYVIAPDAQKHVPWIVWPGSLFARTEVNDACVRQNLDQTLNHDNFYHTVLGLLDVRTSTYDNSLDALQSCRTTTPQKSR